MNYAGCKRKFNIDAYIQRVVPLPLQLYMIPQPYQLHSVFLQKQLTSSIESKKRKEPEEKEEESKEGGRKFKPITRPAKKSRPSSKTKDTTVKA